MDFLAVQCAFQELTGLDEQASMAYSGLLEAACSQVEQRLRAGVDIERHRALLTQLAAAIAYELYAMRQSRTAGSVSVLDVKVDLNAGNQLAAAKALKEELYALAGDLLVDDGFVFRAM